MHVVAVQAQVEREQVQAKELDLAQQRAEGTAQERLVQARGDGVQVGQQVAGATVGRGVVGRGRARHAGEAVERQGQLLPDERELAAVGLRAVLLADGGRVIGHGLFVGGDGAQ